MRRVTGAVRIDGTSSTRTVPTAHGDARLIEHHAARRPAGLLVLTHGAGGGVDAPDLEAATQAATELGWWVTLVQQPFRVAGRRAPPPAARVDADWTEVVARIRADMPDVPLVTGGRSFGARVACRTAGPTGAAAVLCLAFPLCPPRTPDRSRLPELDGVQVPVLVVQGERDPFGCPPPRGDRHVVLVPGDHALRADPEAVRAAVRDWLGRPTA